jgi:hypothetical protein
MMFSGDLWILAAIGGIALLAGFIHSSIGFGFGIVAITLMPLVTEVRQSHVIISVASFPVLIMATWAFRRGADPVSLWQALAGAAIALPLGLVAFEWVSPVWLIRGTGLAILAMVWMSFRNRRRAAQESEGAGGSAYLAGAFGGFLAGAVSIAGPPVAAYALAQSWTQARFKAFVNQFLLAVSLYKIIGLAIRGFIDREVLLQATLLAPLAIVGIQVGAVFSGRLSTRWFQLAVAVALVFIALHFIFTAA